MFENIGVYPSFGNRDLKEMYKLTMVWMGVAPTGHSSLGGLGACPHRMFLNFEPSESGSEAF